MNGLLMSVLENSTNEIIVNQEIRNSINCTT